MESVLGLLDLVEEAHEKIGQQDHFGGWPGS
jgi:hypothetical protein